MTCVLACCLVHISRQCGLPQSVIRDNATAVAFIILHTQETYYIDDTVLSRAVCMLVIRRYHFIEHRYYLWMRRLSNKTCRP